MLLDRRPVLSFSVLSVLSVCNVGVLWPNGWTIKMTHGMRVGLGPGYIVLDGAQLPPKKGAQPHQFSAHVRCGQMAGCIKIPLGM